MSGAWRRLHSLAKPQRGLLCMAVALSALTVLAGVGLLATAAWLLAQAALQPSIAVLQVAIVGVRAFGIGRAVLRYLERLVSHEVTLRWLARLRAGLFRALAPLAPAPLFAWRRGDVLGRLMEDVAALEAAPVRMLIPSLAALLVALVLGAWFLNFDATLTVIALAGLAIAGLAVPLLGMRVAEEPGRRLAGARGTLTAGVVEALSAAGDLLALGREGDQMRALEAQGREMLVEQARLGRVSAMGSALAGAAADLTVVALLASALPEVREGRIGGVWLGVLALATLASFEAVAALPAGWQGLGHVRAAVRRLAALTEERPLVADTAGGTAPAAVPGAPVLEIRDLRFTYPDARRPALDGLSLTLARGRRVAIVGPSGSGKSTLLHLLLRFWDAPPGSVSLLGHDLHAWPPDAARASMSIAAQRAHILTGTLRENLLLGRPDASDGALSSVLRALDLDRLDGGLDAALGEQGARLSGGERQRIALARALLREAPLLLLDEPTAHLDALTERVVLEAVHAAGEGRSTILVTHRLVGLDGFDEVLVLLRGRVAERGPADALASSGGPFARMLALQREVGALELET